MSRSYQRASSSSGSDRESSASTMAQSPTEPNTPLMEARRKRTPLPKFQLLLVYLIQLAEPITAHVITPFINQFVRDTGITEGNESRTGYYAGLIGSAFYFAEALTVFHWGWASDRYGRRPVLLLGPVGLTLAMLCFGLSKSFPLLVLFRTFQGIFNGNIGVSKTVIAELSDETNIADAFAVMPLMWSIGGSIGPSLGGLLAEPARRWPETFGRFPFFHQYPYFLPCAVAGFFALLTAISAFLGLRETLPSLVAQQKRVVSGDNADAETALLDESVAPGYGTTAVTKNADDINDTPAPGPVEDGRPATIRELMVPQIILPLVVYVFQAFSDISHQILLPLVFSTSISNGGLGMQPYQIGAIMAIFGAANFVVQVTFLGRLVREYGPRRMQIISHACYFFTISLYPFLNLFARRAGGLDKWVWAVIILQLTARLTNGMAYGSINIILVNCAPRRSALGATNGLAQAVGSVTRSVVPSIASSLFAYSIEKKILGGNFVYFVISTMSLVGMRLAFKLPKPAHTKAV